MCPGGGDFRLHPLSPAINAGSLTNPTIPLDEFDINQDGNTTEYTPDLDFALRVEFGAIEMGAFEFQDCDATDQTDCNGNGIPDECDIAAAPELDCDGNGVPDACEIDADVSLDCNVNGVLDVCEVECEGVLTCDCPSPAVEIVLVLDTSDSMQGSDLNGVCNDVVPKIDDWIDNLAPGLAGTITVLRLGGSSPSTCGGYPVSTVIDYFGGSSIPVPGDNGACIQTLLASHVEAVAPGAAIVADMLGWLPNSTRIIVPAGDEPPCSGHPDSPSNCAQRDVDAIDNLIDLALAKDVHLLPITGQGASTAEDCTIDLWDLAAQETSGTSALHIQNFGNYSALGDGLIDELEILGPQSCIVCLECDLGPCPWDLNDDNVVNVSDLLALLGLWDACADSIPGCPGDFNCDGDVGVADLLTLLGKWGPCPAAGSEDPPEDVYDCMERYEIGTDDFEKCIEWVEQHENYLP